MAWKFNPFTGALDYFEGSADISGKQDTLVSGTNIKTVNGESLLGAEDIVISGSGLSQPQVLTRTLGS